MLKQVLIASVIIVGVSASEVFAVSSMRNFGGAMQPAGVASMEKTPVAARSASVGRMSLSTSLGNKALKAVKKKTQDTNTGNSTGTNKTTNNTSNTGKPTTASAPELAEISERLDAIQAQTDSMIMDVVETGNGNYVTDVAVNDNKLNVSKTNLLYAPVRNGTSDTVVSNAEIWIVK